MTKEEIKDFSLRITQSSKTELVVVTYDIIINYLEAAKNSFKEDNIEEFIFNVKKAKQFINDLSSNLDFHYKLSFDLMSLYLYANKCLVSAQVKKTDEKLDSVIDVISGLKIGFLEVAKEDVRGLAMPNSSQVYVGLTYGKTSKLNEYSVR
ncbi:MAG: flagellar protein FliS [Clostridiales bacterium]|nr:flagellar protein FliS [Clostridiales bacterium]